MAIYIFFDKSYVILIVARILFLGNLETTIYWLVDIFVNKMQKKFFFFEWIIILAKRTTPLLNKSTSVIITELLDITLKTLVIFMLTYILHSNNKIFCLRFIWKNNFETEDVLNSCIFIKCSKKTRFTYKSQPIIRSFSKGMSFKMSKLIIWDEETLFSDLARKT